MVAVDVNVEVEAGQCEKPADLKLEGAPWTDGLLTVNIESVTSAIAWLAAQLQGETASRLKLEARLQAFDESLSEAKDSHKSTMAGDPEGVNSNDAEAVRSPTQHYWIGDGSSAGSPPPEIQGLGRRLQQLEKDLACQKRQQDLRAKKCEELCQLQVDGLRCDVQSRVRKSELPEFRASLLAEARGIIHAEACEAAQAALTDKVEGLHSKLATLSDTLQSQLDCFDERLTNLAQHLGECDLDRQRKSAVIDERLNNLAQRLSECDQELELVRACSADGSELVRASVDSASSVASPADECVGASAPQSISHGTPDQGIHSLTRGALCSPDASTQGDFLRPLSSDSVGFLHPGASQNADGKAGRKGLGGSRRPSSVASTFLDTNGCNSARDSISNLNDAMHGSPVDKDFVAWVEEQVTGLHSKIGELAALARLSASHDTTDREGADGRQAVDGSSNHSSRASPTGESSKADLVAHLDSRTHRDDVKMAPDHVSSELNPTMKSSVHDNGAHEDTRDAAEGGAHANKQAQHHGSKVITNTNHSDSGSERVDRGFSSSPRESSESREQEVQKHLQELERRVDAQIQGIHRHMAAQADELQRELLSALDLQKNLWRKDLQERLQGQSDAGKTTTAGAVDSLGGPPNSINSANVEQATAASLQDGRQRWLAEQQADVQRDFSLPDILLAIADIQKRLGLIEGSKGKFVDPSDLSAVADIQKRLGLIESSKNKSADSNDVASIKARLPKLEGRLEALENAGEYAAPPGHPIHRNAYRSRTAGNFKDPLQTEFQARADDMDDKIAQIARRSQAAQEEGRRETANVTAAVAGLQRALNLTTAKVEDLTDGFRSLQGKVDGTMPQLLEVLRAMASRDGQSHASDAHANFDIAAADGSTGASGAADLILVGAPGDSKTGPVSLESLQKLISDEIQDAQRLYVSPDAFHRAIKTLENDMSGGFNSIRRDLQSCVQDLRGKADANQLQYFNTKLKDLEDAAMSGFMYADEAALEGESVENACGVRRPLQPSRCLSCDRQVDLIGPWERRTVPKAPWPPRCRSAQTVSPVPGRRRESSLPAINREPSKSSNP